MMPRTTPNLDALYADTKACAKLVGLSYIESESAGYKRQRRGKGFRYLDSQNQPMADKKLRQRIAELVIPPAWQEVWICPSASGHMLATGIDEKGRKQYIYHPKWRRLRDLIKFYRMITFAGALPKIRARPEKDLKQQGLGREKVLATMLWLLDNIYIRIGNEQYYATSGSVGLTTLTDKNVVVAGSVTTLSFPAKSGKEQQITFDNSRLAGILKQLQHEGGPRLFRYQAGGSEHEFTPQDVNSYLQEISGAPVSAKDFRTWGGTLLAFSHLIEAEELPAKDTPKPEKVLIQAVDSAANVLGNTRSVARASYVHPHILSAYGTKNFGQYYRQARKKRKLPGLDRRETELKIFLERLFNDEFDLLSH